MTMRTSPADDNPHWISWQWVRQELGAETDGAAAQCEPILAGIANAAAGAIARAKRARIAAIKVVTKNDLRT